MRPAPLALGAAALLVPASSWACPACALHTPAGTGTMLLIAAMLAVPYTVAAVALKVIRRLDKDPR